MDDVGRAAYKPRTNSSIAIADITSSKKDRIVYLRKLPRVVLTSAKEVPSRSVIPSAIDDEDFPTDHRQVFSADSSTTKVKSPTASSASRSSTTKYGEREAGSASYSQVKIDTPDDPLRGRTFIEPLIWTALTEAIAAANCPQPLVTLNAKIDGQMLGWTRWAYTKLRSMVKARRFRWVHFAMPWHIARYGSNSGKGTWLRQLSDFISKLCTICVRSGT